MANGVLVALEVGAKRVMASGVEWPGWTRGGRTEAEALAALVAYGPRYATVLPGRVGAFRAPRSVAELEVVGRVTGNATTDFGVPGLPVPGDDDALAGTELERQVELLRASWAAFDAARAGALGVELRKGPRGGGRDLDKIVEHTVEAEESYLRQLGARPPASDVAPADRWPALRALIADTIHARAAGAEPETKVKKPWPPRYFVRRAAWHVLDHAWEIEDRSAPAAT